jgi:hypothetical protein
MSEYKITQVRRGCPWVVPPLKVNCREAAGEAILGVPFNKGSMVASMAYRHTYLALS